MNKTEHELNGELKVEGLPVDNVDNALYKVYPKWVHIRIGRGEIIRIVTLNLPFLRIKRENIQ